MTTLLTRKQVSEMFHCSEGFVRSQEARGEWPRIRGLGRKVLYSEEALMGWLRRQGGFGDRDKPTR